MVTYMEVEDPLSFSVDKEQQGREEMCRRIGQRI